MVWFKFYKTVEEAVGAGNVTIGSGTGGSIIGANLISAVNISATNWLNLYTSNVIETSGNLYYTNARVNAQVESNLRLKANVSDLTTANVVEVNNLYYTNARVLSNVTQMSCRGDPAGNQCKCCWNS